MSELCPLKCGICSNDVSDVTSLVTTLVTTTSGVTLTSPTTSTKIISKKENEPNVFFNQPKQLDSDLSFEIFEPEMKPEVNFIPEVGIIPEALLEENLTGDYDYEDEPEEFGRFFEEPSEPFSSWYEEPEEVEEPEGLEILEEFAKEGSGEFDLLTPCERKRAEVESRMMMGAWVPSCNSEGDFEALQCNYSARTCWCVDFEGNVIDGTEEFFEDPSRITTKICSEDDIDESSGEEVQEDLSILDPLKQYFEGSGLFG